MYQINMLYTLHLYVKYILVPIKKKKKQRVLKSPLPDGSSKEEMTAAWMHPVSKPNQECQSFYF